MLRQEDLGFIKSMSTLQVNPSYFKELRMVLSSRKKMFVVSTGSRSKAPGGGSKSSQRPSSRLAGKRKANELASSGDFMEPAIRHPAPDAGSASLPATSLATGEEAANGSL